MSRDWWLGVRGKNGIGGLAVWIWGVRLQMSMPVGD